MINLVTGAPGSGKSYYAVRIIAETLMNGKPVATNIALLPGWERRVACLNPMNRINPWKRRRVEGRLRRLLFVSADLDELFAVRVPGTGEGRFVIVLDECHNWMNSRTWNADESGKSDQTTAIAARLRVVRFFTQHRKVGCHVYAITQDAANIDRQVRTLFEHHIKLKALHNFRVMGIRIVPFKYFLAIWQWNDGAKTILKRQGYPLSSIRKIYDTMALSHGMDGADAPVVITLPAPPEEIEAARAAVRAHADQPSRKHAGKSPPARQSVSGPSVARAERGTTVRPAAPSRPNRAQTVRRAEGPSPMESTPPTLHAVPNGSSPVAPPA